MELLTTDRATQGPTRAEDRRAERKRWFENIVMVPVGVGMIIATAGYIAHGFLSKLAGISFFPSTSVALNDGLAIATLVACALTVVIEVLVRRRR